MYMGDLVACMTVYLMYAMATEGVRPSGSGVTDSGGR